MNEPLYRIWDKEEKRYRDDIYISSCGRYCVQLKDSDYSPVDNIEYAHANIEDYEIERSSGLQNSTGRTIFEEDRVQGIIPQVKHDDIIYNGVVVFKEGSFRVEYDHQGIGLSSALLSSWLCVPFNNLTIVGTIHDEEGLRDE